MNLDNFISKISELLIDKIYQFRFLLLFLVSFLLLTPFLYTLAFVHPFADDLAFASMIEERGSLGFVSDFFQNWSGRYTSLFFLSITGANPESGLFLYKFLPILFLLFLLISIYLLASEFTKGILKRRETMIVSLSIVALHISFMPELFSALYWHCSSFYLVVVSFYLLFLKLIIKHYSSESKPNNQFFAILLMVILISGLHEILIIYNLILFGFIFIYQYLFSGNKKLDLLAISIVILSILILVFIMKFSGNGTRMETSNDNFSLLFIIFRAFYELILLNFVKIFSSSMGLIIISSAFLFTRLTFKNNRALNSLLKIHPITLLLVGSLMIYISHTLTLFAAGYTLPGRVLNVNFLLLYFILFIFFTKLFSYWKQGEEVKFNKYIFIFLILIISSSIFTKNSITAISESRYVLPVFNSELKHRYELIITAKNNGKTKVIVPAIKINPKLFTLGEFNPKLNFYNSDKCLYQTSMYFGIKIKLERKTDSYDFK